MNRRPRFQARIRRFRSELRDRYRWGGQDHSSPLILAHTLGAGYDTPQVTEIEAMQRVARDYGLLFDLNYMIKTYNALEELAAGRDLDDVEQVVLVHTGGQFGVLDAQATFAMWQTRHQPHWVASRTESIEPDP